MTARDKTGFYAIFSARKSGNFLHILGRFPYYMAQKTWRRRQRSTRENSKNPAETAPRNCRFLSLVVVERVLKHVQTYWKTSEKCLQAPAKTNYGHFCSFCHCFYLVTLTDASRCNAMGNGRLSIVRCVMVVWKQIKGLNHDNNPSID